MLPVVTHQLCALCIKHSLYQNYSNTCSTPNIFLYCIPYNVMLRSPKCRSHRRPMRGSTRILKPYALDTSYLHNIESVGIKIVRYIIISYTHLALDFLKKKYFSFCLSKYQRVEDGDTCKPQAELK